MKIFVVLLFLFSVPAWLFGQSVGDARESFYYERYNSSLNILHNVLNQDANSAEAWYWLAQSYFELKKPELLKDTFRFVPPQIAGEPIFLIIKGQILLHENKKDSAQVYFSEAIKETRSKDVFVLSSVARAHISEKTGDSNYAIELLKKTIKREKENAALYTLMGMLIVSLATELRLIKCINRPFRITAPTPPHIINWVKFSCLKKIIYI